MKAQQRSPSPKKSASSGNSVWSFLAKLHQDQRGAVTLETILIVAAIALPLLIFILKFGWPKIRIYFYQNLQDAENAADNVKNNR